MPSASGTVAPLRPTVVNGRLRKLASRIRRSHKADGDVPTAALEAVVDESEQDRDDQHEDAQHLVLARQERHRSVGNVTTDLAHFVGACVLALDPRRLPPRVREGDYAATKGGEQQRLHIHLALSLVRSACGIIDPPRNQFFQQFRPAPTLCLHYQVHIPWVCYNPREPSSWYLRIDF